MAITDPRELLNYHLSEGWLELIDNVAMSPSGRGSFINLSQVNDPVWQFHLRTGLLYPHQVAQWSAWMKSLRGGFVTFLAYDVRRAAPLAYPDATAPGSISLGWSGTAVVGALGVSGTLSLTGCPATYQFKAGDRIGIEQGSPLRYGYYEVLEDATANGSGAVTVTVTPFLHTTIFTPGALARIWRPKCRLVIDWTTRREFGTKEPDEISFDAWQRL